MKYLVKDYSSDEKLIVTGNSAKDIVLKTLERFLEDSWAEDLMETLETNFELDFTNLEDLSTI